MNKKKLNKKIKTKREAPQFFNLHEAWHNRLLLFFTFTPKGQKNWFNVPSTFFFLVVDNKNFRLQEIFFFTLGGVIKKKILKTFFFILRRTRDFFFYLLNFCSLIEGPAKLPDSEVRLPRNLHCSAGDDAWAAGAKEAASAVIPSPTLPGSNVRATPSLAAAQIEPPPPWTNPGTAGTMYFQKPRTRLLLFWFIFFKISKPHFFFYVLIFWKVKKKNFTKIFFKI